MTCGVAKGPDLGYGLDYVFKMKRKQCKEMMQKEQLGFSCSVSLEEMHELIYTHLSAKRESLPARVRKKEELVQAENVAISPRPAGVSVCPGLPFDVWHHCVFDHLSVHDLKYLLCVKSFHRVASRTLMLRAAELFTPQFASIPLIIAYAELNDMVTRGLQLKTICACFGLRPGMVSGISRPKKKHDKWYYQDFLSIFSTMLAIHGGWQLFLRSRSGNSFIPPALKRLRQVQRIVRNVPRHVDLEQMRADSFIVKSYINGPDGIDLCEVRKEIEDNY